MKRKKFTDEDVKKVAKLYGAGFTNKDIAFSTQLPEHVVYYILYEKLLMPRKKQVYRRKVNLEKRLDDSVVNKIIVLTNFGYHSKEISEDQQIPEPIVKQVIENARSKKLIQKKV